MDCGESGEVMRGLSSAQITHSISACLHSFESYLATHCLPMCGHQNLF